MEYGEKITALRKSHKMTQAELGAALNVTFQAVSKWERGESYPDFETLSKISKLFNVPISYFEEETAVDSVLGATAGINAATGANTATPPPAAEATAAKAPPKMIGMCTVCGKIIHEGEGAQTSPVLMCADCCRAHEELRQQSVKQAEQKKKEQVRGTKRIRNRGLIWGAIITAVVGVLLIILFSKSGAAALTGVIAFTILFVYPFTSQLFWDGTVVEVCLCGCKIIGTPGVIFTLDLDGILFLIGVKILFMILKIIVFVICFLFFSFIAMVISPVTFIPGILKLNSGVELG